MFRKRFISLFLVLVILMSGILPNALEVKAADEVNYSAQLVSPEFEASQIYHDGSKYIASYRGRYMTSTNGVDWEKWNVSPPYFNFTILNGKYISYDNSKNGSISFDGITWDPIKMPTYPIYFNYFDGTYFVVNSVGLYKSTDLQTWTIVGINTSATIKALYKFNGIYYVVGTSGTILRSTDLSTWTTVRSGSELLDYMVSNGSTIIAISRGAKRAYESNDNGLTWKTSSLATHPINKVEFDGSRFIIINNPESNTPSYVQVTDLAGVNYKVDIPNLTNQSGFSDIIYHDNQYVIVGVGYLLVTSDFVTFTKKIIQTDPKDVAFGNGKYMVVGSKGLIQTSTDGVIWTKIYEKRALNFTSVIFDGSNFFATVRSNDIYKGIWKSADGISWTQVYNTVDLDTIAVSKTGIILAGTKSATYVIRSTDGGTTWNNTTIATSTSAETLDYLPGASCFSVLYGGNVFLSEDGLLWTKASMLPDIRTITANDNTFIGISKASTQLKRSTNGGTTWTTLSLTGTFLAIYWDGNDFVLIEQSKIYKSPDGNTWREVGTTPALKSTNTIVRNKTINDKSFIFQVQNIEYDLTVLSPYTMSSIAVTSITTTKANGTYSAGEVINIAANFSGVVNVTGTPVLDLNTGNSAQYVSGSGTSSLIFRYVVAPTDSVAKLNYVATGSLRLQGGTIKDTSGNTIVLDLPSTSSLQALSGSSSIKLISLGEKQVEDATKAVEKAETTELKVDYDAAKTQCDVLAPSPEKDKLLQRLQFVEATIALNEAEAAIAQAEVTRDQTDIDIAQLKMDYATGLINMLPDSAPVALLDKVLQKMGLVYTVYAAPTNKAALTSRFNTLTTRLGTLQVSIVDDKVKKAEGTKSQTDLDAALESVNKLPAGAEKTDMLNRITELQKQITEAAALLQSAKDAVAKAETTKSQQDIDAATALVNSLPESSEKTGMLGRLAIVQNQVNAEIALQVATAAVIKAESTKAQADIDNAIALVKALPSSTNKTDLQDRLAVVQIQVDADAALKAATAAVIKAETTKLKPDFDNANTLVKALPEGPAKVDLLNRLKVIQDQIEEESEAQQQATASVTKAEATKTQGDINAAYTLVNALPESSVKATLLSRLAAVQSQVNSEAALQTATAAVNKAEATKSQKDVDDAKALVNALPNGSVKNDLLQRLDIVQQLINSSPNGNLHDAVAKVVYAENNRTQTNVDIARIAVSALPDGKDKTNLNVRLDNIQQIINITSGLNGQTVSNEVYKVVNDLGNVYINATNELSLKINELSGKINELQDKINKTPTGGIYIPPVDNSVQEEIKKYKESIEATVNQLIEKLNKTKDPADYTTLVYIVSLVTDPKIKESLTQRIEELKAVPIDPDKGSSVIMYLGESIVSVKEGKVHNAVKMDVTPYTKNDRTLVPVRFVMEAFNASVQWDESVNQAVITKGGITFIVEPGADTLLLNGQPVKLDTSVEMHNDRLMIPLRFISETLGYKVGWDDETQKIVINFLDITSK